MSKKNSKIKMSKETKETLKNVFGSFINNARAVEGARHTPWWVAIIFFIVSLVLAVLPTFVSTLNASGASFLSSYSKDLDVQISYFVQDAYNKNARLITDEKGILTVNQNWIDEYGQETTDSLQYFKLNQVSGQYDFLVYYTTLDNVQTNKFLTEDLVNRKFKLNSTVPMDEGDTEYYTPSFFVMNQTSYCLYLFNPNTSVAFGNISGDYVNFTGKELIEEFSKGCEHLDTDITRYTSDVKKVYENFKTFINLGYLTAKNQLIIYRNLLSLGIYAGIALFMGLMIFLLTRGKNNVLRIYTYWDSTKIAFWSMLSPSILALILGFIIPAYAIMFFILFYGVRMMWLSMKQLRPVGGSK